MTALLTHKRTTTGIAAVALALAAAAPAAAMPNELDPQGSNVQASASVQPPVRATSHRSGSSSDWAYIAVGTGTASLALLGVGGAKVGRRHRRMHNSAVAA